MNLQAYDTVYYVDSLMFKSTGPADIVLLIKTCLRSDQCGDRFSVLAGFHESIYDRGV